jgi:hypothetical protein
MSQEPVPFYGTGLRKGCHDVSPDYRSFGILPSSTKSGQAQSDFFSCMPSNP